jgi:adenylate cyclase class IV
MARNVELRARVHDLEPLRTRVMALGAIGPVALMQTDTFFNVPVDRMKRLVSSVTW